MEEYYDTDAGTGTYRSSDPIENLKIKIKIQKLSATTTGFITNINKKRDDLNVTSNIVLTDYGQEIYETQEVELSWKEKLFSKRELDFYCEENNCSTVEDYNYHAMISNLDIMASRKNDRIFTYTDSDRFFPEVLIDSDKVTNTLSKSNSQLYENMSGIRRRRANEVGANNWRVKKETIQGVDIVNSKPDKKFIEVHHVIDTPIKTFVIMADLGPDKIRGNPTYEKKLCTIEFDDNNVIRVTPDFNKTKLPYKIQSDENIRCVWILKIEHISNKIGRLQAHQESRLLIESYKKHSEYLSSLVGNEFETIPDKILRLVVHGEIIKCENFEGYSTHVEYFLDAPNGWTSDPNQSFFGCTQSCSSKQLSNGTSRASYFSQPFSYQLFYNYGKHGTSLIVPSGWPRLYVHVISTNSYDKTSSEGYGFLDFPTNPGCYQLQINCWRPLGSGSYENIVAKMRRLFLGYGPQLDDITYLTQSNPEKKITNKYMVKTESTGTVTVSLNCLHQCNDFKSDALPTLTSKKRLQLAVKKARLMSKKDVTSTVIDAYRQARRRMQIARERATLKENSKTMMNLDRVSTKQTSFNKNKML